MANVFTLNILSVDGLIYSGTTVTFVKFTTLSGELGIMANHIPFLTILKAGLVIYEGVHDNGVLFVSGGIVEVRNNTVNILADQSQRAEDLDEKLLLEAKKKAEEIMRSQKDTQSFYEAYAELAKSTLLLRSIQELHKLRRKY
ncbi:ATP synthase F1 subunit epsilon [bacterium]|jgi:F-type H+-transporting ATPase subunit epsilon|nr:ATP synthase F1 subunit epsilon [bacterium]NBW57923.1 ATP synthase F1 subunit epsilon [bacterium]NBX71346.1 ATP synthase F1 subunit epsilon [bacterium]